MNMYNSCKILIENNRIDNMEAKLNLFHKNQKLTDEQYNELLNLLKPEAVNKNRV